MPNRIIKESITSSCEINELSPQEEVFFYRLIVVCDDFGRMDARPAILRAKCFPLRVDKIKESDVNKWLSKLIKMGLVKTYEYENKPYLQMSTWDKHQQRRAKHSKYPSPDDGLITSDSKCNHMQEDVPEESRNRGIEEPSNGYEEEFKILWDLYPNKKGKEVAVNKIPIILRKITFDELERAVKRYAKEVDGIEKKYIKHGSTFFNSGYVDYLDENYTEKVEHPTGIRMEVIR